MQRRGGKRLLQARAEELAGAPKKILECLGQDRSKQLGSGAVVLLDVVKHRSVAQEVSLAALGLSGHVSVGKNVGSASWMETFQGPVGLGESSFWKVTD